MQPDHPLAKGLPKKGASIYMSTQRLVFERSQPTAGNSPESTEQRECISEMWATPAIGQRRTADTHSDVGGSQIIVLRGKTKK